MLDYQGPRCAKCGVALAYLCEGEGVMSCADCGQLFHSDCHIGHTCPEMQQDGRRLLEAWTAATQGWKAQERDG
jgi:hypothetical protein